MFLTFAVVAFRTPATETVRIVRAVIRQQAWVNHTAKVRPSVIYGNRSLVEMGTPLYMNLVKELDLCFVYSINSSKSIRTARGTASISMVLKSDAGWSKVIDRERDLNFEGTRFNKTLSIDMDYVRELIRRIEAETGLRSMHYLINVNISIVPDLMLYNGIRVKDKFTSRIAVDIERGLIKIGPLYFNKTKSIEDKFTRVNYFYLPLGMKIDVPSAQKLTMSGTITSAIVLVLLVMLYVRKSSHKVLIERIYRERLVLGSSRALKTGKVIEVKRIEDLRKVADIVDKPIVRITDGGRVRYCVFDTAFVYCFTELNGTFSNALSEEKNTELSHQ